MVDMQESKSHAIEHGDSSPFQRIILRKIAHWMSTSVTNFGYNQY